MVKEIADALSALTDTLQAAHTACKHRMSAPDLWANFELEMRPHLNTLTSYARRGMLDANATNMLRSAMVDLWAYQQTAMTKPLRGRRR